MSACKVTCEVPWKVACSTFLRALKLEALHSGTFQVHKKTKSFSPQAYRLISFSVMKRILQLRDNQHCNEALSAKMPGAPAKIPGALSVVVLDTAVLEFYGLGPRIG